MERTEFYPKSLNYLFSCDLHLGRDSPGTRTLSWPASQSALSTRCSLAKSGEHSLGTVYHALDEVQMHGRDVVAGKVRVVRERIGFERDHETGQVVYKKGEMHADLVVETDDGCTIHATCTGVLRSPAGRFGLVLAEAFEKPGLEPRSREEALTRATEARAFLAARFDTGAVKYRWLASTQCIGYGRILMTNGEPLRAAFDIYAMQ